MTTQIPHIAPRRLIHLKPDVRFITGRGTTAVYAGVKAGLFPPPIKLGRSSLWIEDEVAAINNAVIAGSTDAELKELVKKLVAARSQIAAPAATPVQDRATKQRRRISRDRASSSAK